MTLVADEKEQAVKTSKLAMCILTDDRLWARAASRRSLSVHCILMDRSPVGTTHHPLPSGSIFYEAIANALISLAALMFAGWAEYSVTAQECATWPRVLPPEGIELPSEKVNKWQARITALDKRLAASSQSAYWADVEVLVKACRLAIEFREFYSEKDFDKCDKLLALAEQRAAWLSDVPGPAKGH